MMTLTYLGWPESDLSDADSEWPETLAYFENTWTSVMTLFTKTYPV